MWEHLIENMRENQIETEGKNYAENISCYRHAERFH